MDGRAHRVRRDQNILAAWAVAVADAVRTATEESTGIAGGGPAALVAVVAEPGLSIDDLRRALALSHPGTVRLVDRLVEQGWVRRARGAGRLVQLHPTAAGRAAKHQLAAARERAVADLLAGLPDDVLHQLADLVGPVLGVAGHDTVAVRRLCRFCARDVCDPCPAEAPDASPGRPVDS